MGRKKKYRNPDKKRPNMGRIPVAPPTSTHRSKKDYRRKPKHKKDLTDED
jgi:hypothetical protein